MNVKKRFAFKNKGKIVWFGPYDNASEARDAYQRRYGYWPAEVVEERVWIPGG